MIEYFIQARNSRKGLWFKAFETSFNTESAAIKQLRLMIYKKTPEYPYYRVLEVITESTVITVINTFK